MTTAPPPPPSGNEPGVGHDHEAAAIAEWRKTGWQLPDTELTPRRSPVLLAVVVLAVIALIAGSLMLLRTAEPARDDAYLALAAVAAAAVDDTEPELTDNQQHLVDIAVRSELPDGAYALFTAADGRCWGVVVGRGPAEPTLTPGRC